MSIDQDNSSYTSDELTHFIGRGARSTFDDYEAEQYRILSEILRNGWLTFPPHEKKYAPATVKLNLIKSYENKLIVQEGCICFCDIPLKSMAIHMKKYSRFGIGFSKSFLIDAGANPVFYFEVFGLETGAGMRFGKGGILFDEIFGIGEQIYNHFKDCEETFSVPLHSNAGGKHGECRTTFREWYNRLFWHIFAHIKPFNGKLDDHDKDNFYMEREWRMTSNLNFKLEDVRRVILPEKYVENLRRDFGNDFSWDLSIAEEMGGRHGE